MKNKIIAALIGLGLSVTGAATAANCDNSVCEQLLDNCLITTGNTNYCYYRFALCSGSGGCKGN